MFITPEQIVPDRPGKKHRLLHDHADFISQDIQLVLPYIRSIYPDTALTHIIETWNQADKRGLSGTGTSDDSDRLTRHRRKVIPVRESAPAFLYRKLT